MRAYFLRRLLLMIPTFIGITIIVFTMYQLAPGGPLQMAIARLQFGGGGGGEAGAGSNGSEAQSITPDALERLREQYGFYKPVLLNLNVLDQRRSAEFCLETELEQFGNVDAAALLDGMNRAGLESGAKAVENYLAAYRNSKSSDMVETGALSILDPLVRQAARQTSEIEGLYKPVQKSMQANEALRQKKFRCEKIAERMNRRLIPVLAPIAVSDADEMLTQGALKLLKQYAKVDEAAERAAFAAWWRENEPKFSREHVEKAIDDLLAAQTKGEIKKARLALGFWGGLAAYPIMDRMRQAYQSGASGDTAMLSRLLDAFDGLSTGVRIIFFDPQKPDEVRQAFETMWSSWRKKEKEFRNISSMERAWLAFADSRYGGWLLEVLRLDLGTSEKFNRPVLSIISSRFPISIYFGLIGFLLGYAVCIPLGIAKAVRHNTTFDMASSAIVFLGYAMPGYALGMILLLIFGVKLEWFPLGGFRSSNFDTMDFWDQVRDQVWHTVLPVIAYMVGSFATLTVLMKNSLMENLGQDYVRTAFAKGLNERRVLFIHALRNSMIPLATGLGHMFSLVLGGSYLIEKVFQIQGFGMLGLTSLQDKDYPVAMGMLVISTLLYLMGNILSDVLYCLIDPRIRFS